ncbi:sigma-70 family RNA polymerase sigma factor [Phormidium sp. FACHB-592]|uniref:Sigma-70 family RNA polymerase sigma factor n=1 Tax=Stenomitos frigidus AS-A4 TaxID=2933935 RepID=A0ABV0KT03_9CYAN|nr:sigma-70 family RNA polymerase sigma factor [Phormidium sp. FACHB-592]MBD2073322.1 sigma-70 family RNA polymerase sigma factor [Phormidium sp. FACHB-592]
MRSRQTLLEIFSTFLQFEEDTFRGWATDARLRRSMQSRLEQPDEATASEQVWVTYWHKRWRQEAGEDRETQRHRDAGTQRSGNAEVRGRRGTGTFTPHPTPHTLHPSPLSLNHLSAYLQESCYWSAQRIVAQLHQSQQRLSDCFQVAIVAVPKVLNAFDSDQLPSLKTYASQAFSNTIRDDLRRRREADRCNDWGLLLKLSRKQLTEALQNAGLGSDDIDRYLLAWTCFEAVYLPRKAPGLRQLAAPDRPTWTAITDRYNQQRQQLTSPGADCTPETLERWLLSCVSRVRAYLYPRVTSLNAPKPGQDAGELQDDVPDRDRDSLLADLINAEETQARQAQQHQINAVLQKSLAKLDPTMQELLQHYYQAGLTQQQIAQQFAVQQYTVSRKLTKARETLLFALTHWSQETLHISPTSAVVKSMSAILEEWLQIHYQVHDSHAGKTSPDRDFSQEYL